MINFCDDKSYFVTKDGYIYSNKSGSLKKLKLSKNQDGYKVIKIKGKEYKVHRIVAMTYIPNPENKPQVNHKDGVKSNNKVSNLEWVTNSENQLHAWRTGLQKKRHASNCKLTQEQADKIRELYLKGYTTRQLANMYNISLTSIKDIISGKYYNLNGDIKNISRSKNKRKLTVEQANEIREYYKNNKISFNKLGKIYNVDHSVIAKIIRNETYI